MKTLTCTYKDTEVYWTARRLAAEIQDAAKRFPQCEVGARHAVPLLLTERLRSSSRGIGENIVIAWGKRENVCSFAAGLRAASQKQEETKHWIATAFDSGYLANDTAWELLGRCYKLEKRLKTMLCEPEKYCGNNNL